MKLYIAGPMREIVLYNFPSFFKCAIHLRNMGHTVVNPAEIDMAKGLNPHLSLDHEDQIPFEFANTLREDFREVLDCDGLVLLPGWEGSEGATAERLVAQLSGRKVFFWDTLLNQLTIAQPRKIRLEFDEGEAA